jgi:hypothetical protein
VMGLAAGLRLERCGRPNVVLLLIGDGERKRMVAPVHCVSRDRNRRSALTSRGG